MDYTREDSGMIKYDPDDFGWILWGLGRIGMVLALMICMCIPQFGLIVLGVLAVYTVFGSAKHDYKIKETGLTKWWG